MFYGLTPLVFDHQNEIYESSGITFETLGHLESIGLVHFGTVSGFLRLKLPKEFDVFYYGQPLRLRCSKDSGNEVEIGKVLLTQAGRELALICGSKANPAVFDYVKAKYTSMGLILPVPAVPESPSATPSSGETDKASLPLEAGPDR